MALKRKAPAATAEAIGSDLQALREDIARLADHVGNGLSTTGEDALDEVKAQIGRITDNVHGLLSNVAEKGQDAKQAVHAATTNFTGSVEESLRAHPLATVGLAVGVGFLLGTVARR
jgi:ElaB/YqjD/DUF883 family membrane-anchored ribosome-binding protein